MISLEKSEQAICINQTSSMQDFVRKVLQDSDSNQRPVPVMSSKFSDLTDDDLKICRLMPFLKDKDTVQSELQLALNINPCTPAPFTTPAPSAEKYRDEFTVEAEKSIGHFFVRNREQKVKEYVNSKMESVYTAAMKEWNERKSSFEFAEAERCRKAEEKRNKAIKDANSFLNPDCNEVLRNAQLECMNCGLPFDTNLFISYDDEDIACIAISVPGIEIIPERKQHTHSRGTGYKDKTKTEINTDYIGLLSSLSYLFSSILFNASAKINKVFTLCTRSGFNVNKATICTNCLMSVVFDRETFNWVTNDRRFLPFENLAFFPHAVSLDHLSSAHDVDPLDLTDPYGHQAGASPFLGQEFLLPSSTQTEQVDSMFKDAAKLVVTSQMCSTSLIQRKLGLGYSRAGRIVDQLEANGIVGPQIDAQPRLVLVPTLDELERILRVL